MTKSAPAQPARENKQQLAVFRKAARELGADRSDERFKDALRKIARAKLPKQEKKQRSAP